MLDISQDWSLVYRDREKWPFDCSPFGKPSNSPSCQAQETSIVNPCAYLATQTFPNEKFPKDKWQELLHKNSIKTSMTLWLLLRENDIWKIISTYWMFAILLLSSSPPFVMQMLILFHIYFRYVVMKLVLEEYLFSFFVFSSFPPFLFYFIPGARVLCQTDALSRFTGNGYRYWSLMQHVLGFIYSHQKKIFFKRKTFGKL